MNRNLQVINLTGREISIDWASVLASSPLFLQDPVYPSMWTMKNTANIALGPDSLAIHPGTDGVIDRVLQALEAEIAYLWNCDVCIDRKKIGQEFTVVLRPLEGLAQKTVFFGRYFQKGNEMEPVEWLVLEEGQGTALLLSKFALHTSGYWLGEFGEAYQENGKYLIWENSGLRSWMNRDFCRLLFSEEERKLLLNKPIVTAADTDPALHRNRVFLLSEAEALRYLPTKAERRAAATGFAVFGGGAQHEGNCFWWVLPYEGHFPQAVFPDGDIYYHSRNIAHGDWCIRPAICISTDTLAKLPYKTEKNQALAPQRKQIPLDADRVYFLSTFLQDGITVKYSVDKELANDSHYALDPVAAAKLRNALQTRYGSGDLVAMLRKFFRTETDHSLRMLLQAQGIPFQQFHFD